MAIAIEFGAKDPPHDRRRPQRRERHHHFRDRQGALLHNWIPDGAHCKVAISGDQPKFYRALALSFWESKIIADGDLPKPALNMSLRSMEPFAQWRARGP